MCGSKKKRLLSELVLAFGWSLAFLCGASARECRADMMYERVFFCVLSLLYDTDRCVECFGGFSCLQPDHRTGSLNRTSCVGQARGAGS